MRRILSIDETVAGAKVYVELRGGLYAIRDLPLSEQLKLMVETAQAQEELEARKGPAIDEDPLKNVEELRQLHARSVLLALEDVPPQVAETITDLEMQALIVAVRQAREEQKAQPITAVVEKKSPQPSSGPR